MGVLATYVTTDQGTGAVHTAPAHGVDDFATGARYGLSQLCDVDDGGRLRHGLPEYDGLYVFKANETDHRLAGCTSRPDGAAGGVSLLSALLALPRPVIFRATEQWFIRMETPMTHADGSVTSFRERALEEIGRVKWDPQWGQERITNMVVLASRLVYLAAADLGRADRSLSVRRDCRRPLNQPAVNQRIVDLFAAEGADAWYVREVAEILPPGTTCDSCGATEFKKEMDILDVWFESGASQAAVLGVEPDLPWPADLYIEGGDQHRGWFQSSLLCAVGTRDAAPYRMAATCGWTLDEQGRAMSKSLGNGVDPVDVAQRLGAEIVRLWVASVDFREDVAASENLMQRVAETYRKLRNTFRFLLSNLNGFQPARDAVAWEQMPPLDQYMLVRTRELTEKILRWYEDFEFHRIYHALNEFAVAELSALYIDAVKDRVYTFAPQNPARRSAQTVLWIDRRSAGAPGRARCSALPRTKSGNTCRRWPTACPASTWSSSHSRRVLRPRSMRQFMSDWATLLSLRDEALKSLEEARKAKQIGKALDARLVLEVPAKTGCSAGALPGQLEGAVERVPGGSGERAVVPGSSRPRCRPMGRNVSGAGTTRCTPVRIGAGPRSASAARRRSTRWAFLRKRTMHEQHGSGIPGAGSCCFRCFVRGRRPAHQMAGVDPD